MCSYCSHFAQENNLRSIILLYSHYLVANLTVVAYRISLDLSQINPSELACIRWFSQDLTINSHLPGSSTLAFSCPCNIFQAFVDARYRFDFVSDISAIYTTGVLCFVSRFSVSGNYQR